MLTILLTELPMHFPPCSGGYLLGQRFQPKVPGALAIYWDLEGRHDVMNETLATIHRQGADILYKPRSNGAGEVSQLNEKGFKDLEEMVKGAEGRCVAVVIDSLSQGLTAVQGGENFSNNVETALRSSIQLADKYKIVVIVLHHTKNDSQPQVRMLMTPRTHDLCRTAKLCPYVTAW